MLDNDQRRRLKDRGIDGLAYAESAIEDLYGLAGQLAEVRATLLVNFGGMRRYSHICDIGDGKDTDTGADISTVALLVRVLQSFAEIKQLNAPEKE